MNLAKISIQNIRYRPLTAFLSILLMAFGSGIIILLIDGSKIIEKQLLRDVRSIDMVVGAKGSPLQLILSGVYHIDDPTGNIALSEFEKLSKHPMIEKSIPLAYGDNYKGYRIVGSTYDYPQHYEAELTSGEWWTQSGEVVLGSTVARALDLKLGSHFHGSHGLGQSIDSHDHFEYVVVGIAEATGSAIDKLILTSLNSVWDVHKDHEHSGEEELDEEHHEHSEEHEHEGHEHLEESHNDEVHHEEEHHSEEEDEAMGSEEIESEITVGLITFRSPMGNVMLPRIVNENTEMQAALPSIEVNRLFSLMGSGVSTLRYLAILIVFISAISVFISLFQSLKDRKYELVLLRVMGAGRWQLLAIILFEGLIIALLGYLLGMLLGKTGLWVILNLISQNYQYTLDFQWFDLSNIYMLPATLGVGIAAALIPALMAFGLNISKELSHA